MLLDKAGADKPVMFNKGTEAKIMRKILALAVAGTLMVTSSVCVFAAEGIGVAEENTDAGSNGGSEAIYSPTTAEYWQEKYEKANGDIADLNRQVGALSAQKDMQEQQLRSLQDQFEAFKAAQERNNASLSAANSTLNNQKNDLINQKNNLTKQLENTKKSLDDAVKVRDKYQEKYRNATKHGKNEAPSRAAQLSRNNAIGDGYGGYIAQGGHVQINGGKSNVTFTLAAPTSGVLSSASQYANSVGGTLLHCVTTSSPGVSFKTATVNFTVTGVYANDTIAVYQLQGKNWVQVLVSSVTDNHVTVNLTQHGPLAFVRVAAVATATH